MTSGGQPRLFPSLKAIPIVTKSVIPASVKKNIFNISTTTYLVKIYMGVIVPVAYFSVKTNGKKRREDGYWVMWRK
jgi:heme/copper-type cytochrome/quinol oxidase subunit 2